MAYANYGDFRWKLCCSKNPSPIEKRAINEIYGVVRQYLKYILTVCYSDGEITDNDNVIYVGTVDSCAPMKELLNKGAFNAETRKEGFSITVGKSVRNSERTDIIIQGADDLGALYGAYEFEHNYLDDIVKYFGYHYENILKPFVDEMPEFKYNSAPDIKNRGLWTWGHMIYDYRRYIENMARCKMNTLIMWNDGAPINGKEIVDYAHSFGVKIIWGFTCAWGEDVVVNPLDPEERKYWAGKVLEVYDSEYKDLGGDGIYFQGFTETTEKEIGGVPIAKLITEWINSVSEVLHNAHPDLYVQFGVHGVSIKENYPMLSTMRNDVTPVWEDCGSFPYNYDIRRDMDIEGTLKYTKGLVDMAKPASRFGEVLKGFTVLRWTDFEHYKGRIIVGETDRQYMKTRRGEKEYYWKFVEPNWINNIDSLKKHIQIIKDANLDDSTVTALVEDGVFEEGVPASVGIMSEVIWNCNSDKTALIEKVYRSVHFDK